MWNNYNAMAYLPRPEKLGQTVTYEAREAKIELDHNLSVGGEYVYRSPKKLLRVILPEENQFYERKANSFTKLDNVKQNSRKNIVTLKIIKRRKYTPTLAALMANES